MTTLRAYIDETGDRGSSPQSSPIFGMAAVLVSDADAPALRAAVAQLRGDFHVPADKVMSWKEHVSTHDRRRRAAELLGSVAGVKVCYVYARKADLGPQSYVTNAARFYNFLAWKTLKSILWASQHHFSASELHVRFGHIKKHDHRATEAYLRQEAAGTPSVPDHLMRSLRWVSADKYAESEAADLYGGFLKAATWPDGQFGYVEAAYLLNVWHQIRNSDNCAVPLGIMSMPSYDVLTSEPWFPCAPCPKMSPRNP